MQDLYVQNAQHFTQYILEVSRDQRPIDHVPLLEDLMGIPTRGEALEVGWQLMATIARHECPGAHWPRAVILQGPQACGKSASLEALSPSGVARIARGMHCDVVEELQKGALLELYADSFDIDRSNYMNETRAFLRQDSDIWTKWSEEGRGLQSYRIPRLAVPFITTNDPPSPLLVQSHEFRMVRVGRDTFQFASLRQARDDIWAGLAFTWTRLGPTFGERLFKLRMAAGLPA